MDSAPGNVDARDSKYSLFLASYCCYRCDSFSVFVISGFTYSNAMLSHTSNSFHYPYTLLHRLVSDFHNILGDKIESEFDDYTTWAEFSTEMDRPDYKEHSKQMERKLQYPQVGIWDPHHPLLVPTIWFYRYDGSLTEPPCGEWVSWFIADTPMEISKRQLEKLKTILFTHVDPDCKKTSAHFDQSVARPVQDTAGRPVWRCTPRDYGPD